jgi:hypothetical protein
VMRSARATASACHTVSLSTHQDYRKSNACSSLDQGNCSGLAALVAAQALELARARKEIAWLRGEVIQLKRRLGMNSGNSSMPPSSDRFSKPAPKSLRGRTNRKQGSNRAPRERACRWSRTPIRSWITCRQSWPVAASTRSGSQAKQNLEPAGAPATTSGKCCCSPATSPSRSPTTKPNATYG